MSWVLYYSRQAVLFVATVSVSSGSYSTVNASILAAYIYICIYISVNAHPETPLLYDLETPRRTHAATLNCLLSTVRSLAAASIVFCWGLYNFIPGAITSPLIP